MRRSANETPSACCSSTATSRERVLRRPGESSIGGGWTVGVGSAAGLAGPGAFQDAKYIALDDPVTLAITGTCRARLYLITNSSQPDSRRSSRSSRSPRARSPWKRSRGRFESTTLRQRAAPTRTTSRPSCAHAARASSSPATRRSPCASASRPAPANSPATWRSSMAPGARPRGTWTACAQTSSRPCR